MTMDFKTPVALIIYNRPEKTQRVFEAIRQLKPARFFVIADGPKHKADEVLCEEARNILKKIDWKTELVTDLADQNLGNAKRTITGLNMVFEKAEEAIILEDDCVPDPSFFTFCNVLLNRYREDEQVMHISGCNLLKQTNSSSDYFFSKYVLPPWGWATWKRAWKKFNPDMDSWQKHKKEIHPIISQDNFKLWTDTFEYLRVNKVTWDIPWNVDIWANNGVGIIPSVNLISNIGFDEQATFTKTNSAYANLPIGKLNFPVQHPGNKKLLFDKELEAACIELLKGLSS